MTVLSRGARVRRGGRRPGWALVTALLVLAIAASSALVFTSRVELLKLAVILALWAAVMAAFVSLIYRRQSDVDQAKARDLKMVYDLQLDREISARREYELTVESQLRRELASELRAQAGDEVAALRAELAALRTNLEILFDADLGHRPALETERTTVRAFSDWARSDDDSGAPARGPRHRPAAPPDDTVSRTAENPIIDVSEVGVPAGTGPSASPRQPAAEAPAVGYAEASHGSPRRASDDSAWSPPGGGHRPGQQRPHRYAEPFSEQESRPQPAPAVPRPERGSRPWAPEPAAPTGDWQPIAAAGEWLPAGAPGSNWAPDPVVNSHGAAADRPAAAGLRHGRHSGPPEPAAGPPEPAAGSPTATGPAGPHRTADRAASARHSSELPGYRAGAVAAPPPPPPVFPAPSDAPWPSAARHRSPDQGTDSAGPPTGGQSVADLLARLQTGSTGGRRRRRREE